MDQKKFTQIAVILVAAVWAFCGTFMISAKIVKSKNAESTTPQIQTTTAPFITTAPTTSAPTTEKTTTGFFTMGGNNISTTVTVGDPQWLIDQQASIEASKKAEEEAKNTTESIVPQGKKNIINAYVDGINNLKDTKNMTVSKASTLEFAVDKVYLNGKSESVSNPTVLSVVSDFLNSNKPADLTYNFENGTDKATGETPITAIAPLGAYAKLDADAVKSAKAEKTVGDGYRITIELEDELQTKDEAAPNHATTVEVIDVAGLMPADATLNYLNITYSGTVIEATFDKNERIVSIKHKLPVSNANGEGTMNLPWPLGTNSASMEMHGEYNCTYTVEY